MHDQLKSLLNNPKFTEDEFWRRIKVARGIDVMRQGEHGNNLYLIESGGLRVLGHVDVNETRQMHPGVCDLHAGDVVGELVLFDSGVRSATVQAVEDSVLIEINGDKLMSFLEHNTDIGFQLLRSLMTVMVGRIRKNNEKIFSLLAWGLKAHQIEKDL